MKNKIALVALTMFSTLSQADSGYIDRSQFQSMTKDFFECKSKKANMDKIIFGAGTFHSYNLRSRIGDGWAIAALRGNDTLPTIFGGRPKSLAMVQKLDESNISFLAITFQETTYRLEDEIRRANGGVSFETIEDSRKKTGIFPMSNLVRYGMNKTGDKGWIVAELNGALSDGVKTVAVTCVSPKEFNPILENKKRQAFR